MRSEHGKSEGLNPEDLELTPQKSPEELEKLKQKIAGHRDTIYQICRARLKFDKNPGSVADDLTNDTMVLGLKYAHTLRSEDALPWLITIANNVVNRYLQKESLNPVAGVKNQGREVERDEGSALEQFPDPKTGEVREIFDIDRERFQKAIVTLPENYRKALNLSFDGSTMEQIGENLNISVSAVKSLLFRARKELGKMFGVENLRVNKKRKEAS